MAAGVSRPLYVIRPREARAHALILAVIAWTLVLLVGLLGKHAPAAMGRIARADFVHFYTLGNLARTGDYRLLYDEVGQHARQVAVVPDSADSWYAAPAYSPLVACLFAPLSVLPFPLAWVLWGAVTVTIYLGLLARTVPRLDRRVWLAGALAFPPLWQGVANGQSSILPFLGFALAGLSWQRHRGYLTGLCLALVALKPQFLVVVVPVVVLACQWRIVAGLVAGIAAQAVLTVAVVGPQVARLSVVRLLERAGGAAQLEPMSHMQHSLRSLTALLPEPASAVMLTGLSVAVIVLVVAVWRRTSNPRVQMSAVVIGTVLVNPHLYAYDALVLALPVLWLAEEWPEVWQWAYWISVSLLLPTAALVRVQVSVLILAAWLWQLRDVRVPAARRAVA